MKLANMVLSLIVILLQSIIGWLVIAPIALIIPKRKDWIGVFGRQDGYFLDNAKYFFLQAHDVYPDSRIAFITERKDVLELFSGSNREALLYPKIKTVFFLLRCGTLIVDEASWYKKLRFFLLIRARIVQLWHGIPFKWIELGLWQRQTGGFAWASRPLVLQARLLFYKITGRKMRYAAVTATSTFYRDASFSPYFKADIFPVIGYPRNDFAQSLKGENL